MRTAATGISPTRSSDSPKTAASSTCGVRLECLLHLRRVHRVAAVLDDLFLAAHEHDRAERAAPGQVTGAQPSIVGDRFGRRVRRAPVAADDPRSLDPELADGPGQHVVAVLVDHPQPVSGQAHADRVTEPQAEQRRRDLGRHAPRRLDHAVALGEDRLAHRTDERQGDRRAHLLEAAGHLRRHDVGAGPPEAHRREVDALRTGLEHQADTWPARR